MSNFSWTKGIEQDIELRIRLAEYFGSVSAEPNRQGWIEYRERLETKRNAIRNDINEMERQWHSKAINRTANEVEIAELERKLAWAYKEVGYVERNRSVSANPRV